MQISLHRPPLAKKMDEKVRDVGSLKQVDTLGLSDRKYNDLFRWIQDAVASGFGDHANFQGFNDQSEEKEGATQYEKLGKGSRVSSL